MKLITLLLLGLVFFCCTNSPGTKTQAKTLAVRAPQTDSVYKNKSGIRTVHIFVALCDNKYQGIVPVGKAIGNGQDADNNLYRSSDNGVRTFFKKRHSDWTLLQSRKKGSGQVIERLLFKHKTANVYLLADAYDGQFIRQTTVDFLNAASGKATKPVIHLQDSLYFDGASNVLAYIGHDGVMVRITGARTNGISVQKRSRHSRLLQQSLFCSAS